MLKEQKELFLKQDFVSVKIAILKLLEIFRIWKFFSRQSKSKLSNKFKVLFAGGMQTKVFQSNLGNRYTAPTKCNESCIVATPVQFWKSLL